MNDMGAILVISPFLLSIRAINPATRETNTRTSIPGKRTGEGYRC
jgi:hypothetical protein